MRGYPSPLGEGEVPSVMIRPALALWAYYVAMSSFGTLSIALDRVIGAITPLFFNSSFPKLYELNNFIDLFVLS